MYGEVKVEQFVSETEKALFVLLHNQSDAMWIPKSAVFGGLCFGDEYIYIKEWYLKKYEIPFPKPLIF